MRIRDCAQDDRPREKMMLKGIASLSDAELLAILIGTGIPGKSAVQLSQEILYDHQNDLTKLAKLTVPELTKKYKGMGQAKSITLVAALELGLRRLRFESPRRPKITGSKDVYRFFQPQIAFIGHEEFWVAYVNQANEIVHSCQISKGGISETAVDVRIILKEGLEHLASGLILAHNHPSGNNRPSVADDQFTRKMKEATQIMDIRLLDHLIVCENCYFSYADEGRL